jgi:hypothetical protein
VKKFDTAVVRALCDQDSAHPFWAGQMRQTLHWACDIIDAANKALEPSRSSKLPRQ